MPNLVLKWLGADVQDTGALVAMLVGAVGANPGVRLVVQSAMNLASSPPRSEWSATFTAPDNETLSVIEAATAGSSLPALPR